MAKKRLDVLLFEKLAFAPHGSAQRLRLWRESSTLQARRRAKQAIWLTKTPNWRFAATRTHLLSRGGKKIEKALNYFDIDPTDLVVMDVGASTGGFTDCLLRRGARKVYSIDVGYGQLAWSLRQDPRVKCMEARQYRRYVTPDMLEETPSFCVIDVSFISLKLVLPVVSSLLTEDGHVANLIKPQFEAGKGKVGKKGVVREPEIHLEVLQNYVENAHAAGFKVLNVTFSPIGS